mgnify:CR=1 FL=1|tara:strand:- start:999 stop:1796 length:798 start_codon:yes stop_codon:yes gene_type:complete
MIISIIKKKIESLFLKICPAIYLGLTRPQDSNERFSFGLNMIQKRHHKTNSISVLDVGCGSGNFFAYLNNNFSKLNYQGVDFNINKIALQKFDNKNFNINEKDLRKSWFYGEHDFVWCSETIEHIMNDQLFFEKLSKSVKKNGHIVLTTPFVECIKRLEKKFPEHGYVSEIENGDHVRLGYNENDLNDLAKENKLTLEEIYFITECDDFRAKYLFRTNKGIYCYLFNILYYLKIVKYKKYISENEVKKTFYDKDKFYCIGAVFKK